MDDSHRLKGRLIMELSKKERLSLYNQYEILKLLNADDRHMVEKYELYQEILSNGYQYNYDDLVGGMYDDTPDNVSKFVWDVLNMYRSLYNSYYELDPEQQKEIDFEDITYQGFDGNEEADYYLYANFILEQMKRYDEIYNNGKVELNSHSHRIPTYKKMLNTWTKIRADKYSNLTLNQLKEIIKSQCYDIF